MDELQEWIEAHRADRHPSTIEKLEWLVHDGHLPAGLMRDVFTDCGDLAFAMATHLEDGPQLTLGLQHLIDAKDCFVRSAKRQRDRAAAEVATADDDA